MSDEDTATTEGMPEAKAKESKAQAPAEADEATTFVRPEGLPFMCTGVSLPQEDGSTLDLPAEGAHVPTADLEALRETAARVGVLLNTEVSD